MTGVRIARGYAAERRVTAQIHYQATPYDNAACPMFSSLLPPHVQTVSDGSATMGEVHSFTVYPG